MPSARFVAVFLVGSEPLIVGARYLLAADAGKVQVLGPLERDPDAICVTRSIADLEMSLIGNQILLTTRGNARFALAFNVMPGQDPTSFERAFMAAVPHDPAP